MYTVSVYAFLCHRLCLLASVGGCVRTSRPGRTRTSPARSLRHCNEHTLQRDTMMRSYKQQLGRFAVNSRASPAENKTARSRTSTFGGASNSKAGTSYLPRDSENESHGAYRPLQPATGRQPDRFSEATYFGVSE